MLLLQLSEKIYYNTGENEKVQKQKQGNNNKSDCQHGMNSCFLHNPPQYKAARLDTVAVPQKTLLPASVQ